jgi:hypothetical protein
MRIILVVLALLIFATSSRAAPGDVTATPDFRPKGGLIVEMSRRYASTLALLKTEFPDDYTTLMSEIAAIGWQGVDPNKALLAAFTRLGAVREKYADKLLFAPSLSHSVMLGRLADFYDAVFKAEGPTVCGRFAVDGSAALFQLGLSEKYAEALDQQSFAYFDAVVRAIEAPNYNGVADRSDWGTVLGIMVSAGAPPSYVDTISSGDAKDPDLCPALAAMFRTSGLLDSGEGARTRADFAKNLSGY